MWILLHAWPQSLDRFIFRDIVVNVALYVPAGITGHLAFRRLGKFWLSVVAPVLICAACSGTIEMVQLFVPSRDCSALDLTTNIVGAVAGVMIGVLLEETCLHNRDRQNRRRSPDRSALALLACWLLWLVFPLFPVMGRTLLRHKLSVLADSPVLDWVPLFSATMVWFVAGNLFRASAFRSSRWLTAISVALAPAQLFIVDRQPVATEVTGAVAGAALFAIVWPKSVKGRDLYRKILAGVFVSLIVLRGLAPFYFAPYAAPFVWTPFGGFLNMDWQTAVQVFAEKFFWYGTAVWLLMAAGMRRIYAISAVVATLLSIEMAQMYLPGRVAEITDPLLGVFAGLTLMTMGRARSQPH